MFKIKKMATDILIIGGGTAGCFAAHALAERGNAAVIVVDKANIKRSGCLAAGVNALNAYLADGQTAENYLEYVKKDSAGVIREDLVYEIARGLNRVTEKLEALGLVILKDEQGKYVTRGKRNVKINGENIKPILAAAVENAANTTVLNRVNVVDYIVQNGRVIGAYGFSLDEEIFYVFSAKAVICSTGGASGIYRPNNPGVSRHKMWYSPFNTGAGYAMGIRAGAEMTGFEMRFIALRCKDTIAPTGTIAQGVGAEQVNALGERYERRYGEPRTCLRVYSTVAENDNGRGPCYFETRGIAEQQQTDLYKAYLNMAPAQTLRWFEQGGPQTNAVELCATEPYIVGGHTGSGYWVDGKRSTTLDGLYAAGDVAGGSPQKYVTGCLVEGEIAALAALDRIGVLENAWPHEAAIHAKLEEIQAFLTAKPVLYSIDDLEESLQKNMDEYAGGISAGYAYHADKLQIAKVKLSELRLLSRKLRAQDAHELLFIYELLDRIDVAEVLIHHLETRKETRWHSFQENGDFPQRDDENWLCYVNSRMTERGVEMILRDLVKKDDAYEHTN